MALPVEVVPFGVRHTLAALRELGLESVEEIYAEIPDRLRFKGTLDIPEPILSERALRRRNLVINSILEDGKITAAEAARDGLKRQVTSPVRWTDSMLALRREGVEVFVEAGPGKVLSGLMRQIDREAQALPAGDQASVEEVAGAVQAR